MSVKIRQEINIIDAQQISSSVTDFFGIVQLDTTSFINPTYYFEVVAKQAGTNVTLALRRNGTSTDDATVSVNNSSFTRFRSTSFTPPDGQTDYILHQSSAFSVTINSARIIIIDNPTTLATTQTQIEIGNSETGKTNTAAAALTNPKYWLYTAANWDGTKTFYAECTYAMSTTKVSGTIKLQEDNGSFASWADKVTIVNAGTNSTQTRIRSVPFTPTDGRHYRIVTSNSSSKSTLSIYNAKIIVYSADGAVASGSGGGDLTNHAINGGTGTSGQLIQAQAQGFKIQTTSTITGVTLRLNKTGSPTDTLNVDIVSTLGGTSLANGTLSASSVSATTANYTVTFGASVSLSANTNYYIQLTRSPDTFDSVNHLNWSAGTTNFDYYGDGTAQERDNNSWAALTNADNFFSLVGQGGVTKLEPQYLLLNTTSGVTGLEKYQTLYDSTEWSSVTNTYKHAMDAGNALDSSKLQDIDNGNADVTNSTVTGANQQISSALTMPTSGHQIDTNIIVATSVYASRILVASVISSSPADLTVNVSDSITLTESIGRMLESNISTSDNVTITEFKDVLRNGARDISVNDSITLTESIGRMLESYVNKSDSVTITESLKLLEESNINVSDSITITENLQRLLESYINKSDNITITESINLLIPELFANVSDNIAITESLKLLLESYINKSDSITITENIQRVLESFVNTSDNITLTESLKLLDELNINKSDSVNITESTKTELNSFINVSDSITVTESKNVQIAASTDLSINVNDSITITESIQRLLTSDLFVSDSITVTENLQEQLLSAINVSENVTITENLQRVLESFINKSDSITLTESISLLDTLNINVSDNVTVTESITVNIVAPGTPQISVSDSVTVSESIGISITGGGGIGTTQNLLTLGVG